MEQQFLDLLQHDVEVSGKLIAVFGGEDGFVVDDLLDVGHDIVHILGGRYLALLALVIHPHVSPESEDHQHPSRGFQPSLPGTWPHHVRAGG